MEGQHRGPRTYVAVDVVEENQKLLQCSHDNYAASQLPTVFPWAEAGTVGGTAPMVAQACAAQAPAPAPPPGRYARNCNYISENHHLQRKTSTQQETQFFHPIAGPPPAPYYTYNYQFVGGHQLPHFVGMASAAAAAAAPHQHHQLQESLHAQAAADPPPHHRRGQQQQHQQQIGVAKAKAKEQPLVLHDKDKRNRRRGHRTLLSSHLYETCGNNQIQQIPGQHLVHDDAAVECDEYRYSLELLDDDHYASTLKMDPDEDLVLRTYNARIDDDSPEAVACCSVLPGMLTKTVVAGGESGSAQDTGRNFCLGAAAGSSGSSCQGATGTHGNGVGPLAAGVGVRSGCPDCEEKFGTSTSTGSRDHPTAGPPPMSTTTTKEDEVEAKGSAAGASLKREDEQADAPSSPGETSTACPQSPDVAGGLVPGSVGTTGRRVNVHKQLAPHQAAASSTSSSIGIGVDKEQTFPSSTSTAQTHQEKDETNQLRYQDGGDVEVEVALAVTNGDGYAIVPTPAYCEDGGIAVAYDTSCPSVLAAATQAGGEQVEPGGGCSYTAYNEQPMDVQYGCATTTSDLDGRIVGILEMTTEKKNLLRTGYDKIQHVANQCLSLTYRQLVESEPAAPKGTATVVPYGSVITGCLLEDGSDLDVGVILRGVDCHSDSSCQSQSESDVLFLSRMLPLLADIGFQKLELVANAKVPVLRGELVVGDQLQNTHSSSYDQHHHYHQLRAEFDISLHKDDYVFHNSLLLRDWLRGGDGQNLHHHGHPQTACLRIWTREFPTPGGAATSRAGETSTKSGENMRRRTSAAPQFPFPGSAQQALELDRTFLPYRFSLVLKQWGKFVTLNPNRPDAPAFIRRSRCNSYATTAPSARTSRVVDHDREGGSRTHGAGGDQPLQRQPRSVEEENRAAWPPLASSAGGPPVGPPLPRGSWCGAGGAGNRAAVVEYGTQSQGGGRGQAPRPSSQSHVPPPPPPHQPFSAAQQSGGSSNIFSNQRAPFLQFRPTQHRPLYLNNYCLLLMMFYYLNRRAEYFWTTFHAAGFPGPNWDLPAVFLDFGRFWLYEFQPEREVVDIFTGTPADVNRAAAPTHLHLVIKDPVRRHLFRGLSREQYALFLDRLHEARCVATHPPCPHYGLALCVGVAGKWMSR